MNERIQKLAEQAIEMVSAKRNLSDGQVERAWSPDHFNEVFAELIIRECVNLALNGKYDYEKFNAADDFHRGHNTALDFIAEGITQHFGIE